MPTLDIRAVLGALLNVTVLTLLCHVPRTGTQGLPPALPAHPTVDYEDHHEHTFYRSHVLPDGREKQLYFYKGSPDMYFFLVEKSHTPLEFTVTPCASPIVWSLQRRPLPPRDYYDEPSEDPILRQLKSSLNTPVLLGNWSENGRRTYHTASAAAGLYVLNITSVESDSVVRVLATSTGSSHPLYPLLPVDRDVQIVRISGSTFTFRWPDASAANVGRPVEYCVTVNRVRNFRTHCAFISHSKGDPKPVRTAKDRWGFPWEKQRIRNQRQMANPVRPISPRKIHVHQCVGSKREFTVKKARAGKTYYVDVYVVDKDTNKAEAFKGAVVKMPARRKNLTNQILDGGRKLLKLQKNNVPQEVTFEAKQQMSVLSVELGVCAGKLPFEIYHNGKRVHRSKVKRWKRVRMKNVLPGTYTFKFPRLNSKRRKSFVSVYVTSRPAALTLPRDMSIKVFDSMTTCTNVTVAWMGTHKRQKYCLYVKEASQIGSLKRHRCSSAADRPKSQRVLCMRYKNKDVSKAVMSGTITGLRPDTSYMVDVYLSRGHSGPVAYKSVRVKTKANC